MIITRESGPSLNVLGERDVSILPLGDNTVVRLVSGLVERLGERREVSSMVGLGSGAAGLPDIIASQTESTSIVAAAVLIRGFFSTFLYAN